MKLELKHLAAYLPYKLQARYKALTVIIRSLHVDNVFTYSWVDSNRGTCYDTGLTNEMVPLLRPLSDLVKGITHNGETFVPMIKMCQSLEDCPYTNASWLEDVDVNTICISAMVTFKSRNGGESAFREEIFLVTPHMLQWQYEKMVEWHFDVYGLIEAGLAVAIVDEVKTDA